MSSLLSDVEEEIAAVRRAKPLDGSSQTKSKLPERSAAPETEQERQRIYEPATPRTSGNAGKWIAGGLIVAGGMWFLSSETSGPSRPAGVSTTQNAVNQTQTQSRPSEERPPVGENHSLSMPQLRYCVAEDIRLDAARGIIDNANNIDVGIFNSLIKDYNSRCGSFRYRRGSLETAKSEVEKFRFQIQAEGRSRFRRN
jgi:hypothetical protein